MTKQNFRFLRIFLLTTAFGLPALGEQGIPVKPAEGTFILAGSVPDKPIARPFPLTQTPVACNGPYAHGDFHVVTEDNTRWRSFEHGLAVPGGLTITFIEISFDVFVGEWADFKPCPKPPPSEPQPPPGACTPDREFRTTALHALLWAVRMVNDTGKWGPWTESTICYANIAHKVNEDRFKLGSSIKPGDTVDDQEPSPRWDIEPGDRFRVTCRAAPGELSLMIDDRQAVTDPEIPQQWSTGSGIDLVFGHVEEDQGPEVTQPGWIFSNLCVNYQIVSGDLIGAPLSIQELPPAPSVPVKNH